MFASTVKKMVAVMACMVLAVAATAEDAEGLAPCPVRAVSLDKSGTSGEPSLNGHPQLLVDMALAEGRSLEAERAGFEPAVRFDPHTAFPVPRLRPLGHLSETA